MGDRKKGEGRIGKGRIEDGEGWKEGGGRVKEVGKEEARKKKSRSGRWGRQRPRTAPPAQHTA